MSTTIESEMQSPGKLPHCPIPTGALHANEFAPDCVSETPPTTMTWRVPLTKMPILRPETYVELAREGISLEATPEEDGEGSTDSEEETVVRPVYALADRSPFYPDENREAELVLGEAEVDDVASWVSPFADNFVEHFGDALKALHCFPPRKRKSIERIIAKRVMNSPPGEASAAAYREEGGDAVVDGEEGDPVVDEEVGGVPAIGGDGLPSWGASGKVETARSRRRVFRDDDEAKVSGGCSGDEEGMTHRELAAMFGLSESCDEAHFRLRDFRRSLLSKLSETHLSYIRCQELQSHLLCDAIGRRKMTPREFAEKLLMVQFHYQLHNGRLPSFAHRVNQEALGRSVGPEMAAFVPEVGRLAFENVRRGLSIDNAVKSAQKQIASSGGVHR